MTDQVSSAGVKLDFDLYLVTDRRLFPDAEAMFSAIEEALRGGVRSVQLREKDLGVRELLALAYRLREITGRHRARLFINDRVDVAMAICADGVHLGRSGIPAYAAKKASSGRLIVGVSTHSVSEAREAVADGADFITFGPVFQTPSKLKYGPPLGTGLLSEVCSSVSVPVFAIGGVTPERTVEVHQCGAAGVAVITAILGADERQNAVKLFLEKLK